MIASDAAQRTTGRKKRRQRHLYKGFAVSLGCILLLIWALGCTAEEPEIIEPNEQEQRLLGALNLMQNTETYISNLSVTGVDSAYIPSDLNIDIAMTYTDTRTGEAVSLTTRMMMDTGVCVADPFDVYADLVERNDYIDISTINTVLQGDEATPTP